MMMSVVVIVTVIIIIIANIITVTGCFFECVIEGSCKQVI